MMTTTDDDLLRAVLGAILRAESDNHVPRVVVALESIAKSLELLASKHGEQRGTWPPGAPASHMGLCAKCDKQRSLNEAGWCFDCFSGKSGTPT